MSLLKKLVKIYALRGMIVFPLVASAPVINKDYELVKDNNYKSFSKEITYKTNEYLEYSKENVNNFIKGIKNIKPNNFKYKIFENIEKDHNPEYKEASNF